MLFEQTDMRMRLHGLRQLVNDKSVASLSIDLLQVDCLNLLSTGLLQVVFTSWNKSANGKSRQSSVLTCWNFMKLRTLLLQLIHKFQQAAKPSNLQEVWRFSLRISS